MTLQEWLTLGAVLAGLLVGLPLFRHAATRCGASAEAARKSVHVAMGLVCATFPWIFSRPLPVWVLAATATAPLLLLRSIPSLRHGFGSALHGIQRVSYGELLFAPAVAVVFHLSQGDPLAFVIPVLVLTVADAAGALAGTRWGQRFYVCGTGRKSLEGSAAFLSAAFLCTFVPIIVAGRAGIHQAVWISLILAILAMMAEGISDRGFDNLLIPPGCHFVLERLFQSDSGGLALRFVAAVLLLVLVITGSRWSTLSGSSLIAAALLGYACAMLADVRFSLPLVAIFFCHLATTRKHALKGVFDHRLDAVVSPAIASLFWTLVVERGLVGTTAGLVGVSIAMATHLSQLVAATRRWLHPREPFLARSVAKGWLVAAPPGLIWLWDERATVAPVCIVGLFLSVPFCIISPAIRSKDRLSTTSVWVVRGILSLLASLPALTLR